MSDRGDGSWRCYACGRDDSDDERANRLAIHNADLLAERDALAAEVEQLRTIVDAVEDDLGDDYLAALTEGDDRG